jgi:epoxyqueuosine reductase
MERLRRTAESRRLEGFGVCGADPFPEVRADLEARRAAGMHGSMRFTFADPARSTDVRISFPWAERLVVGAWAYVPRAGSPGSPTPGTGRIARFATEDHYAGLRSALGAMAVVLQESGRRAEVLADDNRLVDRAAAVRAGVAWWGKNTMVLAPRAGPWLLLGSVVTDAHLPVSRPMRRDCGTCAACLPACPTGALVEPGVLDARRCLAHLAQAPGPIPAELRTPMGDRIYGCDDCLDACPPGSRLLASSRAPRGRVDLLDLLAQDDRTLLERHAYFYVPRRRARFLRRNALVALGNSGGPGAVGVCAGYAAHPDPLLRAHAVWALGRLGGAAATAALRAVARREQDPTVRREVAAAVADSVREC